jgi:cellulose synthase/poly-beta-1,6-N-acetylglucosamine synthase-like glycosyltransferase
MSESPVLSIVVIGRNEGARLVRCLESIRAMRTPGPTELIYVDSNSSDDSTAIAAAAGARVIALSSANPTAAAGRNAGWRAANAPLVLFLDGDTVLYRDFVADSLKEFESPRVAIVFGNRREIDPEFSLFNRVVDLDWIPARARESKHCGGDALVRRSVLEEVEGFDDRLIAGEEPDMCRRMRGRGWVIIHLDRPMTGHDLAMSSFAQYWNRAVRTGYACAEVSRRYRNTAEPFWQRESRHNLLHGALLSSVVIAGTSLSVATETLLPIAAVALLIGALAVRTAVRARWKSANLATLLCYGIHSHFQHIPILLGQVRYWLDLWRGRTSGLIEYKSSAIPG